MVKRRSFNDIDITKDFEKRLTKKNIENQRENFELHKIPLENMSLKELETFKGNQITRMEEIKLDDVYSKILLEDVR